VIREWCAACGERFVEQLLGNGETVVWCPRMCQCNDWNNAHYDAGQMAEAFWSAIAHERAEYEALREAERQVREEIAIRHMTGFGRGFTARDAFLAEAPGIKVRQVTTKDEG